MNARIGAHGRYQRNKHSCVERFHFTNRYWLSISETTQRSSVTFYLSLFRRLPSGCKPRFTTFCTRFYAIDEIQKENAQFLSNDLQSNMVLHVMQRGIKRNNWPLWNSSAQFSPRANEIADGTSRSIMDVVVCTGQLEYDRNLITKRAHLIAISSLKSFAIDILICSFNDHSATFISRYHAIGRFLFYRHTHNTVLLLWFIGSVGK